MTYEEALASMRARRTNEGVPAFSDTEIERLTQIHVKDSEGREKVRQWVRALRSEVYKQTASMLHSADGGFCCLGVYCEAVNRIPLIALNGQSYPSSLQDEPTARDFGRTFGDYAENLFAAMNDRAHMTFDEIADVAEAVLLRPVTFEVVVQVQADDADEARAHVEEMALGDETIQVVDEVRYAA